MKTLPRCFARLSLYIPIGKSDYVLHSISVTITAGYTYTFSHNDINELPACVRSAIEKHSSLFMSGLAVPFEP